jgi:hypothetical protein
VIPYDVVGDAALAGRMTEATRAVVVVDLEKEYFMKSLKQTHHFDVSESSKRSLRYLIYVRLNRRIP